jgi:hypothetical protein
MLEVMLALSPPLPWEFSISPEWVLICFFGLLIVGRRIMKFRKGHHHD